MKKIKLQEIKYLQEEILHGAKGTVAWAARSGRDAANHIMKFLEENQYKKVGFIRPTFKSVVYK